MNLSSVPHFCGSSSLFCSHCQQELATAAAATTVVLLLLLLLLHAVKAFAAIHVAALHVAAAALH
jgi:hypothetical protein